LSCDPLPSINPCLVIPSRLQNPVHICHRLRYGFPYLTGTRPAKAFRVRFSISFQTPREYRRTPSINQSPRLFVFVSASVAGTGTSSSNIRYSESKLGAARAAATLQNDQPIAVGTLLRYIPPKPIRLICLFCTNKCSSSFCLKLKFPEFD
jgi:hypothetical protein